MTTAPGTPTLRTPLAAKREAPHAGCGCSHIQICWKAVIDRRQYRALVIAIDAVDADRCAIEAWVGHGESRESIFPKRVLPCAHAHIDGLLHMDVYQQDERVLAMTMREGDGTLLYARTSLLSRAGFHGGSYDRPQSETTMRK